MTQLNDANMKKSAEIFKAVGNLHRLKIIAYLIEGEKHVSDINAVVNVSQPALSQHLRRLRAVGVLGSRRDRRQIYYFIAHEHRTQLVALLTNLASMVNSSKLAA